ncbi:zinc-binding in reverse transcriptase [Carex littledalei]|uniref:Zinc-binding in reverse transcriptase n=1 Tax=Carex littledalei TaxID=544730 RepID=A0A833REP8_9POAL|nr:zinc-binding in reverse transcriptase [Carex littledalei]
MINLFYLKSLGKSGKFTIKKAYQLMWGPLNDENDQQFWMWIWQEDTPMPKLKMFVWRCCWKALPVQAVLAARIRTLSPLCKLCERENETIMHSLFFFDFARLYLLKNRKLVEWVSRGTDAASPSQVEALAFLEG